MTPGGWDVDFSLALRNRTGKYFIGRDLIAGQRAHVAAVRFGRVALAGPPGPRLARALAIASDREVMARVRRPRLPGRIRAARPVLHLDPYTAVLYELGPRDAVLCHDMGPLTHPDLFAPEVERLYAAAYGRIAARGPTMAFVSRASRDAYVARYGPLPEMPVIYPPLRREVAAAAPEPVTGVDAPFLITVGSVGRRKNQAAAIAAFAASGLAGEGFGYVLCGAREPGAEAVAALAARTPGVVLLPYVSDGALAALYREAAGFVLVSLLEGFGVPVVEAIAAGLVPLVSRGSVLEEVAGPGALTADPADVAEVAAGMRALAGLGAEERAARRAALSSAIARFTPDAFNAGWHAVLAGGGADPT